MALGTNNARSKQHESLLGGRLRTVRHCGRQPLPDGCPGRESVADLARGRSWWRIVHSIARKVGVWQSFWLNVGIRTFLMRMFVSWMCWFALVDLPLLSRLLPPLLCASGEANDVFQHRLCSESLSMGQCSCRGFSIAVFHATLPAAQDWRQQPLLAFEMRQRVERRQAWDFIVFMFCLTFLLVHSNLKSWNLSKTIEVLKLFNEPKPLFSKLCPHFLGKPSIDPAYFPHKGTDADKCTDILPRGEINGKWHLPCSPLVALPGVCVQILHGPQQCTPPTFRWTRNHQQSWNKNE